MEQSKLLPDILTGEMIDVYNPLIPIEQKVDAIKYEIDNLDSQIKECVERKSLWNERSNRLKQNKENLRDYLFNQLELKGSGIKTIENNAFITTKSIEVLNIDENQIEDKYFDYSITFSNLAINDVKLIKEFVTDTQNIKCKVNVDKKLNIDRLPEEFKTTNISKSLTIRKNK